MSSPQKTNRDLDPADKAARLELLRELRRLRLATRLPGYSIQRTHGLQVFALEEEPSWLLGTVQRWAEVFDRDLRWRIEMPEVVGHTIVPRELLEFPAEGDHQERRNALRAGIKRLRQHLKLTGNDLDRRLEQAERTYLMWETGRNKEIHLTAAQRVVRALGGELVFWLEPRANHALGSKNRRRS